MAELESGSDGGELEARVARLEALVARLTAHLETTAQRKTSGPRQPGSAESPSAGGSEPRPGAPGLDTPQFHRPAPEPAPPAGPSLTQRLAGSGERWLARMGIGFVILAVAFLLKLSFDRGWITPLLRLWMGGGIGVALLVLGLRIEPQARRLAQALMGGSIAVFYLVGWAGFQLYQLIPFPVAFALMCATTVLALVLAERQDSAFLGVVGISGGLSTPFLLDSGFRDVNALAIYVTLILLGGGFVHFRRGWHSLLATLGLGGAAVLMAVTLGARGPALFPLMAIAAFWLVGVGSPLSRWVLGPEGGADGAEREASPGTMGAHRASLIWTTGFTAGLLSTVFRFDDLGVALTLLALALILAMVARGLRPIPLAAWPAAETSALALLGALWIYPGGEAAIFLTASAAALFLVLRARGAPGRLDVVAHLGFGAAAFVFVLTSQGDNPHWFGGLFGGGLFRLGALAMAALVSLQLAGPAKTIYQAAAYLGLLLWSYSIFQPMANGAALVSVAWTIQGAAALMAAVRQGSQPLQFTGLATIVLVAVKMLVFDLSELDPVWRILLFMGFGVGLMGLAWLLNRAGTAGGGNAEGEAAGKP